VILCDARPTLLERRSAWSDRPNAAHSARAPDSRAKRAGDRESDRRRRAGRTRPNPHRRDGRREPVFVQQLLSMLIDDGLLLLEDGQWSAPDGLRDFAVHRRSRLCSRRA